MNQAATAAVVGPALCKLALLALLGAGVTEWSGGAILGKGPAHLWSAAVVLTLLSSVSRVEQRRYRRGAAESARPRASRN